MLPGDLSVSWAVGLAFLTLFLANILLWKNKQKKGSFPPGPFAVPILGNLLQVNMKALASSLIKLSEKYGPVFSLYLGPQQIVVLCGYDTVKEALINQGEEFGARGVAPVMRKISGGYGIVNSNGETWKQLRRFSIMTLKQFGMGKKSIEERICEEAQFLVEEFKKTKGSPCDPLLFFSRAVSNIICTILFGDRFDYEDERFRNFLQLISESVKTSQGIWGQLYVLFPKLMDLLPGPHKKMFKVFKDLKTFLRGLIEEHKATLDPEAPRDYIDSLIIKIQQEDSPGEFHSENMVMSALDLFIAGTETTSTTLRYGLTILLKYPHIQEKIRQEIDQVTGGERSPRTEDRGKMPYTDAVIHEIQRFADILPLNLTHSVTQETKFRGYTLPKGTAVIPLLTSVLRDPTRWESPYSFNPNHFLNEDGSFKRNEAFMPFSCGKRVCLGEGLARMELFLFLTTLLQNFTFKSLIDPQEIDITSEVSSFGNMPRSYKLCAVDR